MNLVRSRMPCAPLLLVALLLAAAPRVAGADTVLAYPFEDGVAGWQSNYQGARITTVRERSPARTGAQCLEVTYRQGTAASPAFFTYMPQPPIGAKSVRFWIQCSAATPLQFALGEKDASGYYYAVQCPANRWVRVTLPLSALSLAPATKDENGQLDPDQLDSIRFQDLSRYHSLPTELGPLRIWLDQLEFVTERDPGRHETRTFPAGKGVTIDTFDTDALGWEAISGVDAQSVKTEGRGVARLSYRQGGTRTPGILTHLDGSSLLAGVTSLRIVVRSKRPAQLQILLMEYLPDYRSVTYVATVAVPPSTEWTVLNVPLQSFRIAAGSSDPDNRLDPTKVWMVRLQDTLAPVAPVENVLELDEVAVVRGR